ncbi:MAG: HlyD family efflux transporter periplasmic adaptor subunit [Rudaea sp.]
MNRSIFKLAGNITAIALAIMTLGACSRSAPDAPKRAAPSAQSRYVAMARGQVDVAGGLIRIVAPRDGIITQLHGAPGSDVRAGDVLAILDPAQSQSTAAIAKAELDEATAHAAALRARVASVKQRADRAHQAAKAGAASDQSADDAAQALAELDAQIAEATATAQAAQQRLKLARHEVEMRTLRAPVAARVVARNAHVGDVVSPQSNTALFTLLPDAAHIVRAELNEAFVAKVAVGMHADVVADVDTAKVYKATVTRIGEVFGPSKLVEDAQEATDTRDVACILTLQGRELLVGQRVQVRFLAH